MEGVTDSIFRQMVVKIYKPDVMFTEFVSVEGMNSGGRAEVVSKLQFTDRERPLIAQVWGVTPELFFRAAKDITAMGFDGIDINMGCPDKNVTKIGGGAALIENTDLAGRIIRAVQEGVRSAGSLLPVSVKTRIGYARKKTEEWVRFLLSNGLDALTIHGLTAKELYKRPSDWDEIKKAVDIGKKLGSKTIVIGNGNVTSYHQVLERHRESGADGIMIGRGIFQDINCFDPKGETLSHDQLLQLLVKHLELFEATYGATSPKFAMMKKFFKLYIRDFDGSALLREKLMSAKTTSEALKISGMVENHEM
jgi:tRNA-dihydrouridine synthase